MSHFMVAVMAKKEKDIAKLLEPFDEEFEVEPYVRYTKSEIIEMAKERKRKLMARGKEEQDALLEAETDEELYEAYKDEEALYDDEGNELTTYNPLAKWDWYEIGGRYNGLVIVKQGTRAVYGGGIGSLMAPKSVVPEGFATSNGAKIKDICWDLMSPTSEQDAIHKWALLTGDIKPEGEDEKMYLLFADEPKEYDGIKDFIESETTFSPYAFIDSAGNWHERGDMGWFGMSDTTKEGRKAFEKSFRNYISDPEHQEEYMVIVDCHI